MKRFISAALIFLLVSGIFAGCAGENGSKGSSGTTAGYEEKTSSASKQTLVMATEAGFPPYEFYDGEKIVGIDAEIAALIAEKLGMELEIKDMSFKAVLAAVPSGVADIGMAGMTVSPDRAEKMSFSIPYAKGVQVVMVTENSEISSLDGLKGKTIGVQEDTTGDIYATDEFGENLIKRYKKYSEAIASLKNGTVDAVILDNEPAKKFIGGAKGLKLLPTPYASEDYAIAVSKTRPELLEKINAALKELEKDGSLKKITDKYISG